MVSLMKVEMLLILKLTVTCQGNAYFLYTFTLKVKTFTNETFAFLHFLQNLRKFILAKYFLL